MIEFTPNEILFKISAIHLEECRIWRREIEEKLVRQMLETGCTRSGKALDPEVLQRLQRSLDQGEPLLLNVGAIGGVCTYSFATTASGSTLTVHHAITADEFTIFDSSEDSSRSLFVRIDQSQYQQLLQHYQNCDSDWLMNRLRSQCIYQFCNTTLGQTIKVKDLVAGTTIDLSDYQDW